MFGCGRLSCPALTYVAPLGRNTGTHAAFRQRWHHRRERANQDVVAAADTFLSRDRRCGVPGRGPERPVDSVEQVRGVHRLPSRDGRRGQDLVPVPAGGDAVQLGPSLGALKLAGLFPGRCHLADLLRREQPQIGEKFQHAFRLRSEDLSHENSYGCGLADHECLPVGDLPFGDLVGTGLPPRLGGRT
jgi:hypothetical protein